MTADEVPANIPWKWVTSIAGVLVAGALAFAVNVSKDATIALELNQQHGEQLLLVRGELSSLREEIKTLTKDRYTTGEATRDLVYIERRLSALEEQIEKHDIREHGRTARPEPQQL